MTTAALGHDLRIVVLQRIIGMIDFMAFGADHTAVFCTMVLDTIELCGVATATVRHGKRCDRDIIDIVRRSSPGKQSSQQEGCARHADNSKSESSVNEHFLAAPHPPESIEYKLQLLSIRTCSYRPYKRPFPTPLLLQIVGINMAVNADRHLFMHGRRMRLSMAGLALRYTGMRTPMAESACKRLMLGGRFGQQFTDPLMARHTESPRRCQRIGNLQWMMRRMAGQTIIHGLSLGVRFMTLETLGNLTMNGMTEGTRLLGMGTGKLFEFLALLFMTGQTRAGYICGQG